MNKTDRNVSKGYRAIVKIAVLTIFWQPPKYRFRLKVYVLVEVSMKRAQKH